MRHPSGVAGPLFLCDNHCRLAGRAGMQRLSPLFVRHYSVAWYTVLHTTGTVTSLQPQLVKSFVLTFGAPAKSVL